MLDGAITKTDLAARWSITPGRVSQYVKAGLPVREDGLVDVAAAEAWRLENVDMSRADGGDPAMAAARLRKMQAEAEAAEIALRRQRGALIDKADIMPKMSEIIMALRDAIIAIPRNHVSDAVEAEACEAAIVAALHEFADHCQRMADGRGPANG